MIRGFAAQPSPRPGGTVVLHVSTDAPAFRVEFLRCGAEMTPCGGSAWLAGAHAPTHLPFHDWTVPNTGLHGEPLAPWPGYVLPVPPDWRSGVYVALLVEGDGAGGDRTHPDRGTPDAREGRALFTVRAPAAGPRAPVLYKLPLFTYHAYDLVDGAVYDPAAARGHWCLYNMPGAREVPVAVPPSVHLHRPGGGTGGVPYDVDNFDPFDPTPRQTYVHWDHRMVAWLEREGYAVDCCTDLDLHREGMGLLAGHRLLVSAGHDEYWTAEMRDAVEAWTAAGGNAVFLGGNTCWWRVAFRDGLAFSREDFWHEAGRPENAMTGVSFRNGGERDRDDHPEPVGFRVQHCGHWAFAGTGLRDGDVLGGAADQYLVGYECDGAAFDRAALAAGTAARPSGEDGTPDDFTILGVGDTRAAGWGMGNGAATMGLHEPGGTVFTGATTDWPRVLTDGRCPELATITRNVVRRLAGPPGAGPPRG